MSRLTQMIDYINKEPKELTKDYVSNNYTHFTIKESDKKVRKKYRREIKSCC
jgi:hypothetical protein